MELFEEALGQGITSALVVAIYLIIAKIIDSRKENIQAKLNDELVNSINKISTFILDITKNIVEKDREKCKNAIDDAFYSAGLRLVNFVSTTVVSNNIDTNKEIVVQNIHNVSNAEYYAVSSSLGVYNIDGTKVSDYMKNVWIEDIEKAIYECVYSKNLSNEDKILVFNKKINLQLQTYVSYVTSKIAK